MSKKIQSRVVYILLAGRDVIFKDMHTIEEIHGLGPKLFNKVFKHTEVKLGPRYLATISAYQYSNFLRPDHSSDAMRGYAHWCGKTGRILEEYYGDRCGKAKGIMKKKLASDISDTKILSGSANKYAEPSWNILMHMIKYAHYLMTVLWWHFVFNDNSIYKDLNKKLTEKEQEKLDNEYDKNMDPDFISLHAISNDLPLLMTMSMWKSLVFAKFPMMATLLILILKLHNINTLTLNIGICMVDVLMIDHSKGKGRMLSQFLSKNQTMKGKRIMDNDINNDVEQSDDEVEVINGPPAASTSHTSGSSHKSASATSITPEKTATSKKSSGHILRQTIRMMCKDKWKRKAVDKAKTKNKAVGEDINMDDDKEGMSVLSQSKKKPRLKPKVKETKKKKSKASIFSDTAAISSTIQQNESDIEDDKHSEFSKEKNLLFIVWITIPKNAPKPRGN
ncbi:hypothetical protein C8R48DRAFT_668180 [Suillus tomentosus]|nr:hypothetical protein C8R48DRAFT_668180 [Suillus tomentosus]